MLSYDDEVGVKVERSGSASNLTWLIAGVGIGAVAGISGATILASNEQFLQEREEVSKRPTGK